MIREGGKIARAIVLAAALATTTGCGGDPKPPTNHGEKTVPIICSSPTVTHGANGGTTIEQDCQLQLPTPASQGSRTRASS